MIKKDILLNGIVVGEHESSGDNQSDMIVVRKILKEKGLLKEFTTNDLMYGQANSFAAVANKIYKENLKTSPYKGSSVSPFVVNSVFSTELYLKTIHEAYGNKVRGHHLESLYKGMPKKGKAHLLAAAADVRLRYKLPEGATIHTCLQSLSLAFEQWRYIYEHNQMNIEIQSIRYMTHVSHEACCRVREEMKKT